MESLLVTSSSFLYPTKLVQNVLRQVCRDTSLTPVLNIGPLDAKAFLRALSNTAPSICLVGDDEISLAALREAAEIGVKAFVYCGVGSCRSVGLFDQTGIGLCQPILDDVFSHAERAIVHLLMLMHGSFETLHGPRELYGKTLLLLGFGRLGLQIAVRALAFGMHVVVCNPADLGGLVRFDVKRLQTACNQPNSPFEDSPATIVAEHRLANAMSAADAIIIALPYSDQTDGLVNSTVFESMKYGAVLINAIDTRIVTAEALVGALKSGRLAAYACDVPDYFQDTADKLSQVFDRHRLRLTCQSSSMSVEAHERRALAALGLVENIHNNLPVDWVVPPHG